jgi:hypothetical protein
MAEAKAQRALLQFVAGTQQLILDVLTEQRLVLALALLCTAFAIIRIRSLFRPLIKLLIVYTVAFVAILAMLYGPSEVANLNSLKQVKRSAKAAVAASVVCFFLGYFTPKKARRSS